MEKVTITCRGEADAEERDQKSRVSMFCWCNMKECIFHELEMQSASIYTIGYSFN